LDAKRLAKDLHEEVTYLNQNLDLLLERETSGMAGRWSKRFMWAAMVQGSIAAVITILLAVVLVGLPSVVAGLVATILANPAAGFVELAALFGFFAMYIVVGVLGTALTALLYQHVEVVMEKTYEGTANMFAWVHFLLMNIGVAGATWPMIYAGFWGDIALGPPSQGGLGWTLDQVAAQILAQFLMPVGLGLLVTGIGALAGIIGFLITCFKG
jgi:hypothetical protein